MKRFYLLILVLGMAHTSFAQYQTETTYAATETFPRNEVNFNIANVIAIASVELGYERFFAYNQSAGVKILINDRMNYRSEDGSKEFKTRSFRLNYTYYFGGLRPGSGLYIQPFVKYRFGDFEEEIDHQIVTTNMNAFMVGIGGGYQWNFSNSFTFGPFVNIARNFSSEVKDRFSQFDFNAGVNIGYRF